ncbi:MAG: hypothetical protein AAB511_02130 [Patescibacteria group bacterium]
MKSTIKEMPIAGQLLKNLGALNRNIKHVVQSSLFYLKNKKLLSLNKVLAGSAAGRRAFILATGPSIKTQDLSRLQGELCVSVSNFFVHPDFKKISPEYHIFPASHKPITVEQMLDLLRDAEKHFPDGQKIFMSATDKYLVEKFGVFKKQKVYYYLISSSPLTAQGMINFSKRLPIIQTSPHIAVYLSLYLDVKEIYLLGVDHDWILHIGETRHFYDEKKSALAQTGYNEWLESDLGTECEAYGRLWKIYRQIRTYATKHKVVIINATTGSLLDVFPRANLEEILKK